MGACNSHAAVQATVHPHDHEPPKPQWKHLLLIASNVPDTHILAAAALPTVQVSSLSLSLWVSRHRAVRAAQPLVPLVGP